MAQTIDWTGGGGADRWDDKNNWSGGDIPDSAAETPQFNVAGSFPVELTDDFTVDDLSAILGAPSLRPSSGVNPTLTISDDLLVLSGANFSATEIGGEKLTIDVADALRIDGGSGFTASTAGGGVVTITVDSLRLADIGSGSGDLSLIGADVTFDQTGATSINIGQDGSAQLLVSSGARATFAAPVLLANLVSTSTTAVVVVESGARLNLNSLQLATIGFFGGTSADVTVTGASSVADLSGALTIGGASAATGIVKVNNSGRLDAGGLTTVATNGTLTVDGGTFNAMAGLDASAGTLNHLDGAINVTGGAFVPVDDQVASDYVLDSVSNPALVIGAGGDFTLAVPVKIGESNSGTMTVEAGGGGVITGIVDVGEGAGANGSLTVTGAGSTFRVEDDVVIGRSGDGVLHVTSGGVARPRALDIADLSGSTGEVTVDGVGSLLRVGLDDAGFERDISLAAEGTGMLTVTNGGRVEARNLLLASATGSDATVVVNDGVIELSGDLSVGFGGDASVTVETGGELRVGGRTRIFSGEELVIEGGTLIADEFDFEGGSIDLRTGGTLISNGLSDRLVVTPAGMRIGGYELKTDLLNRTFGHTIEVAGGTVITPGATFAVDTPFTTGGLTISSGGIVGTFFSTLTVNGPLLMDLGSVLTLGQQDADLGDASRPDGVVVGGNLQTATTGRTVTLLDSNDAVFDSGALVELFGGDLVADNGITIDFGGNLVGEGMVDTPDDPTKPLTNNGHIAGNSPTEQITLTGYVKGVGTCDNCVFTGTDAPGFSPATVIRGSVAYRGVLEIEIGGTGSGSFDRLEHLLGAGVADLGGELQISLIDDYVLAEGDSIEFLTADGGVTGMFATESLPALGGGLGVEIVYGANSATLVVTGVAGDFNYDGTVDAADYTVWRDAIESGYLLAADANNDGALTTADYDLWVANFGSTAASTAQTIPEPSTLLCLLTAAASRFVLATRRR